MRIYDFHLRTAKEMEKYLDELEAGLNGSEIMQNAATALLDNKTVYIPEISATLHWVYMGYKPWNLDGKNNSTDINDYRWQLL